MTARLIEPATGNGESREIPLKGEEFLIGRGTDCDLRLGVSAVSRHHCLIRLRGKEATLTDLGSSNGTYVNGIRLRSAAELRTGDEIGIGSHRFVVDLGDRPDLHLTGGADPFMQTCKLRDSSGKAKDAAPPEKS